MKRYITSKSVKSSQELDDYDEIEPGQWEMVNTKRVLDSDGFETDYSLWQNGLGEFITIFGDNELYTPENTYPDMEFNNATEALDWFMDYEGIYEDEDEDYTSSEYGDYSPSNPWDAPGMSKRDFV